MGQIQQGEIRKATPEEINYFWCLDKKRPYMFNNNIDEAKFKKSFELDEEEYFGRQLTFIEKFDINYGSKLGDPKTNHKKWK